jgi:hypothetical protein
MPILQFVGVLLLVGILLWGVTVFPYCDAGIKKLIQIVVVVVAALWVVSLFFNVGSLAQLHVGK